MRVKTLRLLLFIGLGLRLMACPVARASPNGRQDTTSPSKRRGAARPAALRVDLQRDLSLTVFGGVAWIASETAKADIDRRFSCRWCDRDASGALSLNPLDRAVRAALHARDVRAAQITSNLLGYGVVPLLALGLDALAAGYDHRLRGYPTDLLLIAQATVAAIDINQLVKYLVRRPRPYVAFAAIPPGVDPADGNLSFFSAHTTLAFALAVSAGTVATLRRYRLAPLVWGVGLAAAATTGVLRIVADRHYFTDVLVGAATGAALGVGLPWAHRVFERSRARAAQLALVPTAVPAGGGLGIAGVW